METATRPPAIGEGRTVGAQIAGDASSFDLLNTHHQLSPASSGHAVYDASRLLALERPRPLNGVARAVVDLGLADFCTIELIETDGSISCGGAFHSSPEFLSLLEEISEWYPQSKHAKYGYTNVIRTGKPEMHKHVTDPILKNMAVDHDHYEKLKRLNIRTLACLPVYDGSAMLGSITVGISRLNRFEIEDLSFLENVAALIPKVLRG